MSSSPEHYMRMALKLARKAVVRPSERALGGAVLVVDGKPVAYAHTNTDDDRPAALMVLQGGGPATPGAVLYTNIEPCLDCRQPDEYLSQFLDLAPGRIVIGVQSPVQTDGSSQILSRLASSGITLETGLCEQECLRVNEVYYKYGSSGTPFVTVKFAASLDGRIATSSGDSRWISSPPSLRFAHQLRREHNAVLVGIGTVLADDPQLTVRLVKGPNPIRVVADSSLRIPEHSRVLSDVQTQHTIIATTEYADMSRVSRLERLGAEILVLPRARRIRRPAHPSDQQRSHGSEHQDSYGVDLPRLLAALGERQIASLLVEGGSGIITSLLANRSVDRVVAVIAPKIIGYGTDAIGDLGIERLRDAITFSSVRTARLGADVIFDGRIRLTPGLD
jgi:diaminohydroxyphosphoribosylaminopyrimidine deaminase/5-amino-6-(5-phosphoribosylamino)uracil reductase